MTDNISGPVAIATLNISNTVFTLGINDNVYTIPIPVALQLTFSPDSPPSVSIPLDSVNEAIAFTSDVGSISLTANITFSLLFCLLPVPPVGWVNLQADVTLSGSFDGEGVSVTIPAFSFAWVIPIISVEEGD
jgi:hypothetical protein